MRGEHGREGAGCDDGTSALTGHLRGRCSSTDCSELASLVLHHPKQLALHSSTHKVTQHAVVRGLL